MESETALHPKILQSPIIPHPLFLDPILHSYFYSLPETVNTRMRDPYLGILKMAAMHRFS